MTKDEFRAALDRLGVSQMEVGRLLDVAPRTPRRWALGETPVPGPVEMHLRMWLDRPDMLAYVRQIAEKRDAQ